MAQELHLVCVAASSPLLPRAPKGPPLSAVPISTHTLTFLVRIRFSPVQEEARNRRGSGRQGQSHLPPLLQPEACLSDEVVLPPGTLASVPWVPMFIEHWGLARQVERTGL